MENTEKMAETIIGSLVERGVVAPQVVVQAQQELHMALKARLRRMAYDLVDAGITEAALERLSSTERVQ